MSLRKFLERYVGSGNKITASSVHDAISRVDRRLASLTERLDQQAFKHLHFEDVNPLPVDETRFLLFTYPEAFDHRVKRVNLGDYMQTLAVENALKSLNQDIHLEYFDRDNISNYRPQIPGSEKSIVTVMQGFFWGGEDSFPNKYIYPVYIGTHLGGFMEYKDHLNHAEKMYKRFIRKFPTFFNGRSVGCRDKRTTMFFKTCGIDAYFSRCLTLTLPSRPEQNYSESKVLVAVRAFMEEYIPQKIAKDCIKFNPDVDVSSYIWNGAIDFKKSSNLINETREVLKFYSQAKLVITDRIHVAAPCIAMGVPVVIIKFKDDDPRYDIFEGLTKVYSFEDLKKGRIDLDVQPVAIQPLKDMMLAHFDLTIKSIGITENKYESTLQELRKEISNYKV